MTLRRGAGRERRPPARLGAWTKRLRPGTLLRVPRSTTLPALRSALVLLALALFAPACVSQPTMRLHHAEINGIRIAFPPSLGVLMTVVIDVNNPNSYDVAVRAVRGQVLLANRYTMPVDFRADGSGIWLPADRTTRIRVPVNVPVALALSVLRESFASLLIPYRFSGRADVTATRTLQIEKDDYSVDEQGAISRQQIEAALAGAL
jgi:hypothetical protein